MKLNELRTIRSCLKNGLSVELTANIVNRPVSLVEDVADGRYQIRRKKKEPKDQTDRNAYLPLPQEIEERRCKLREMKRRQGEIPHARLPHVDRSINSSAEVYPLLIEADEESPEIETLVEYLDIREVTRHRRFNW